MGKRLHPNLAPANCAQNRPPVTPIANEQAKMRQVKFQAAQYCGPLPPPEMLRQYDDALPGAAERILVMAEKNNDHRIEMTHEAFAAERNERRLGQIFGLVIGLVTLALAAYFGFLGLSAAAITTVSTVVAGLVGVFVTGRFMSDSKSSDEKK